MNARQLGKLQERIDRIKKALSQLGALRPGNLSRQYNVCGNPTCRCKDPNNPRKHGPYYQLSYTRKGKSRTEFVRKERVPVVQKQLKNYETFKRLTEAWIEISLEIARLGRDEYKVRVRNDQGS